MAPPLNAQPRVAIALEKSLSALGIPNLAQLAVLLRVSTQAVHAWAVEENIPPKRALQIHVLTGGAVAWEELMPDFVEETIKDAVLQNLDQEQATSH